MMGRPGLSRSVPWAVVAFCLAWLAQPGSLLAQRELRVKAVPETPLPFVTPVIAPSARHIAVCDSAGVVAVAHRPKSPAQLSFFKLDPQGQVVAGEPVTLDLPKPGSFGAREIVVLAIVAHPTLPLLYVWQDIEPLPDSVPTDPALLADFDHLLVFAVDEPQPKLIYSTARGADFAPAVPAGAMAINATATRLYIPNLQQLDSTKKYIGAVGWLVLDADGLPGYLPPNSPREEPVPTPVPAPLDPAAAAAARTAKVASIEQAKAAGQPLVQRLYLESVVYSFNSPPAPYCYAPLNDEALFLTSHSGIVSWSITDRLGRFCYLYVQPYVAYRYRIAVHPVAPSVYVSIVNYDGRILRWAHADGQFTLTPQTLTLDNVTFVSTPLVLEKTNQLVTGGNGRILLIDLDAEGKFTTKAVQMTVNSPLVEGIAWSKKFGRLYVPVEKTP